MSKDPAFLFYPGDWLGGTMGMTFEQKGAYIDLLMLQFNRGHMTKDMIGQTVGQIWDIIQDKFVQDDKGLWFNERLDLEKFKRKKYTESRRNNIKGKNQYSKDGGHTSKRMEDKNEDVNEEDIIKELENNFSMIEEVGRSIKTTPENVKRLLDEFIQDQKAAGELSRTVPELRSHFSKWAKKHHKADVGKAEGKRTHWKNGALIKRNAQGSITNPNDQYK